LGNFIILIGMVILIYAKMEASWSALLISYLLHFRHSLAMTLWHMSHLENQLVSVERINEFINVKGEKDRHTEDDKKLEKSWPKSGEIVFEKYSNRYRESMPQVLKKIDLKINKGEKVGIVGRTGAGKSSLTVGLFRLIEPDEGKIIIDGVDISKIGLNRLRSKLTIIPQDPVTWSGTIRYNLDPLKYASDEKIWFALEKAGLKESVKNMEKGLETEVSEDLSIFSDGEKQMLCLARALLRDSKILIMDEATASVDNATDRLIQETVMKEFSDWTILTIAHRLNTIIGYDRILVLDKGRVEQYGSPKELLEDEKGQFYDMCKAAKLV